MGTENRMKPIKNKSLSEQVYDSLVEYISGMEPGNTKLPSEEDLGAQLGVSRATIREALKRLLMNRLTTTIHGNGTFAHPAVLNVPNRLDINGDFKTMLESRYKEVEVKEDWSQETSLSAFFLSQVSERKPGDIQSRWLYQGDGNNCLYCRYYFREEYIARPPKQGKEAERFSSLPRFSSKCMNTTIDYCVMKSRIIVDPEAARAFGLAEITPLHCWQEQIYDVQDHVVGYGEVFVHPENMELYLVTQLVV